MTTMFKTINDHADQARAERERELEALNAKRRNKHRKKATRAFLIRAVIAWVVFGLLWLAMGLDLIIWQIALPLECGALLYFMGWFGAWVQFMWCRKGLLR